MDPLSITASIIAVLQATKEVISYVKETKDAPKELTEVYEEARNLVILLYELKDLVVGQASHETWLQTTSALAVRDGPVDQYRTSLEILVPKITNYLNCLFEWIGRLCLFGFWQTNGSILGKPVCLLATLRRTLRCDKDGEGEATEVSLLLIEDGALIC